MKFLEIINKLGNSTADESEKELLQDYYVRLREMIRKDSTDAEIEHRFCLMMAGYIMRYISRNVDYSKTQAEYYIKFLKPRLNWGSVA
ncbi:hypothetical protein [Enterococcus avium]|uniref:hypothetical protein n=1 Tax=Enterococcus avium TaxID=33945 RepID=UPI001F58EA74|nr:hypothetical protein [Enterococcus avium]